MAESIKVVIRFRGREEVLIIKFILSLVEWVINLERVELGQGWENYPNPSSLSKLEGIIG